MQAAGLLAACATPDYYVDRSAPDAGAWGYEETRMPDGRYDLSVALPSAVTDAEAHAMWDRRAAELCPDGYEKNAFEAVRPTVRHSNYGGVPGGPKLRGYVTCATGPEAV